VRLRLVLSSLVVVALIVGIGVYVVRHDLSNQLPTLSGHPCAVTDGTTLVELDGDQMANAATIAAVGIRAGLPERALTVALATALQESKLRNLSSGDRDSIGLFQQRPSQGWGRPDQLADPRFAARRFYSALKKVRGWQTMRITEAAQRVQRSAYPEAYQRWTAEADLLAAALVGRLGRAVTCTKVGAPPMQGELAAQALTAAVRLDWGEISTGTADDVLGLVLTAADTRGGWQYAHWLVAHSTEKSVKSVRYDDQLWTSTSGKWTQVNRAGAGVGELVVAEVYSGT
jgi:hypothetical protein